MSCLRVARTPSTGNLVAEVTQKTAPVGGATQATETVMHLPLGRPQAARGVDERMPVATFRLDHGRAIVPLDRVTGLRCLSDSGADTRPCKVDRMAAELTRHASPKPVGPATARA